MASSHLFGAIELGGTKIICAIGDECGNIISSKTIATSVPDRVIPVIVDYFGNSDVESIGIGTFGPVDLDEDSEDYGSILKCVKPGWSDYPLLKVLKERLNVPAAIDTDVNAACIGECQYGIGSGMGSVAYITVGTGIGLGLVINGLPVHGLMHPEGGHVKSIKHPLETMDSICRFHDDCVEGFACGPAIEKRWGAKAEHLAENTEAWEMEAFYLSQLIREIVMIVSPELIIMGGGVMKHRDLFEHLRDEVHSDLNAYIPSLTREQLDSYIVPESLNGEQAIKGSLYLARKVLEADHTA
jgi:fructokinase